MPALSERLRARVLPTIAAFGRWWVSELRAMVPAGLSLPTISSIPRADILPTWTGVELVRIAEGQGERFVEQKPLAAFDAENWAETRNLIAGHRTRVLLRAPLIHVLTLKLPKAARRHLRSAIPLQLRDHSPLAPELLHWAIVDTRTKGDHLLVRVAIVRVTTLDEIEAGCAGHDLPVPPIFAEIDSERPLLLRPGRGRSSGDRLPRPWLVATALLVSTPLWMLLALKLLVLREAGKVDATEVLAKPRLAAERRLRSRAELGAALNTVLAAPSITGIVEELANRIPETAHAVDIAGQDDGTIGFTLDTTDPDALRPTLAHDPRLPGLREIDQTKTPAGQIRVRYEMRSR